MAHIFSAIIGIVIDQCDYKIIINEIIYLYKLPKYALF